MAQQLDIKKNLKRVVFGLYVLVMALIGTQLFFDDQLALLANSLRFFKQQHVHGSAEPLVIGYALKPASFEPTLFDPVTRNYLADIYQGLVRTDRNLRIGPAVAVSWGLIDQKTWEFRLRPGVLFHNGNEVTPDDIVASIQRAKFFEGSQLKNILGSVQKVEVVGKDRIRIHTTAPDPLLLNKLAVAYIFPRDLNDYSNPVGTGPYKFFGAAGNEISLMAFEQYWGERPFYQNVVLKAIASRNERIVALENGDVQFLTNLPPSAACALDSTYAKAEGCRGLKNPNLVVKSIPSLEVSFIIFNFINDVFNKRMIREAVAKALDTQVFVELAFGFAKPAGQFVSSGIFGFNPAIKKASYNLDEAVSTTAPLLVNNFQVTFDYPAALDTLGEYLQLQMIDLGIEVFLNPLSDLELQQKVLSGTSDFYFLGWRSELGDASDFLASVAHSREETNGFGHFNGVNYMNEKVDQLVKKSAQNMNVEERLSDLQEAMRIVVKDDVLGVPLYESDIIYGFDKKINFEPRVDGYVYPSEIK